MAALTFRSWLQFNLRHLLAIVTAVALTAAQPVYVWRYSEPFYMGDMCGCGAVEIVPVKGHPGWLQSREQRINLLLFTPGGVLLLGTAINRLRRRIAVRTDTNRRHGP
jgi:hypothetical protein